jgi:NADP-dependent 3-hydroxy acid dehydrogenase YdfG
MSTQKIVLVTGASSGIGQATAERLFDAAIRCSAPHAHRRTGYAQMKPRVERAISRPLARRIHHVPNRELSMEASRIDWREISGALTSAAKAFGAVHIATAVIACDLGIRT